MRPPQFDLYLARLIELSRAQRATLLSSLQSAEQRETVVAMIEETRQPQLACPRCGGRALCRHGHASGLQRFRCCACGRTFNSLTGTPLARLRMKSKWLDYCATMLDESATVRRAAKRIDVHRNTSFRWRHRFLTWVKRDWQLPLRGVVEADEMYVRESQKGSRKLTRPARRRGSPASRRGISRELMCVLVARDRERRTFDAVTGCGPVSATQLSRHLAPVLASDAVLCTDGHAAYPVFCRQHGISHEPVNVSAGERVRGAFHVQGVNAYHSRLRAWLLHFRGVATRYLANYCGWRRAIDGERLGSAEAFLRAAVALIHS